MQLDFNQIISGEKPKQPEKKIEGGQKKLTKTDARQRQQSCMIKDIDKDLLPANSGQNPTNFRVSLSDMLMIDQQDQSLQNYKKQLLGDVKQELLKEDEAAEVEILKVQFVLPDRQAGNIIFDFASSKPGMVYHVKIKQAAIYCLRIHFIVRYDIVFGLKYVNNVFKLLAKVDKQQQKMGSFAPQEKHHTFDLPWHEAPQGFLARGDYKGKGLFLDNDGIVHCQFDYVLTIGSDW